MIGFPVPADLRFRQACSVRGYSVHTNRLAEILVKKSDHESVEMSLALGADLLGGASKLMYFGYVIRITLVTMGAF